MSLVPARAIHGSKDGFLRDRILSYSGLLSIKHEFSNSYDFKLHLPVLVLSQSPQSTALRLGSPVSTINVNVLLLLIPYLVLLLVLGQKVLDEFLFLRRRCIDAGVSSLGWTPRLGSSGKHYGTESCKCKNVRLNGFSKDGVCGAHDVKIDLEV